MKELWRKKSVKAAFAAIVILAAVVIVSISAQSFERKRDYNGHIDSAEKYLAELNYEQAIVEYTLALEIEPNAEKVLDALEQTYLDYAQSLADAGDYEKAVSVLEDGYAMTGRESMQTKEEKVLDALEQTYLDYAQSLADAGDYEKAVSVLEDGYVQTGRESMQTKKEELLHNLQIYASLPVFEIYSQLVLSAMQGNGCQQYISDAQIKEVCSPAINYLEQYSIFYELDSEQRRELCDLYYWTGEFERCKEMFDLEERQRMNMEHDLEVYGKESARECSYTYNEYGRIVYSKIKNDWVLGRARIEGEVVYEYGENGKIIKSTVDSKYVDGEKDTFEQVFEYDAEGKISKTTESSYDSKEDIEVIKVYTYVYNEKGFTQHYSYESSTGHIVRYSRDCEINEYGVVVEWGETYDAYEF